MISLYKIETHLHTNVVSPCGKLSPQVILEGYAEAGYSGIVVTDHLMPYTYQWLGAATAADAEKWDLFRKGYEALCRLGPQYNIRIYFGAELRFQDEQANDYLVYGCPDELLKDTRRLFEMDISRFHSLCREAGSLVIQAHPFRGKCCPSDPCDLDGVEVYNSHPRHENNNHLAFEFAKQHRHLVCFSGSDCHRLEDIGRSGIMTETLPFDEAELVTIIRERRFSCIIPD